MTISTYFVDKQQVPFYGRDGPMGINLPAPVKNIKTDVERKCLTKARNRTILIHMHPVGISI